MNEQIINRVINQIYEAAYDDERWQAIMDRFSRDIFSSAVGFDHNTWVSGADPFGLICDIDPHLRDLAIYHFNTPETHPGIAAMLKARVGQPFSLESFVDARMFDRNEAVRTFFHPHKFDKGLFVAVRKDEESLSYVSLFRTTAQDCYSDEDVAIFARLAPHISRALKFRDLIRRRLRFDKIQLETFKRHDSRTGLLTVDRMMKIIDADAASEFLLKTAFFIRRRGMKLASQSRKSGRDTAALHRYIDQARPDSEPFVIDAQDGSALKLRVVPIGPDMHANGSAGMTAIIVEIAASNFSIDFASFITVYELTPAEGRFIEAMTKATSATDAAGTLGITRNTAKYHLAHIFQKTDTASQTQLMLLLGRF